MLRGRHADSISNDQKRLWDTTEDCWSPVWPLPPGPGLDPRQMGSLLGPHTHSVTPLGNIVKHILCARQKDENDPPLPSRPFLLGNDKAM